MHRWANQRYLFVLFIVVLTVPNLFLFHTERLPLPAAFCNIAVPASVYWLLMSLAKKPGIVLWLLFPFVFLGAFQLVLLYLFGESIIAVDMFLNLVTTNSTEALELLDKLLPSVIGVCVLYLPTLALGVVSIRSKERLPDSFLRRNRRLSAAAFGIGAISIGGVYAAYPDYRIVTDLYPVNVCYNAALAVERENSSRHYAETSHGFTFGAVSEHDPESAEVYVFVIGETGRALNWGLYGYERNTTPRLAETTGLTVFSDAITQSNTTHKSVPILLSPASAEDYDCLYRQKGILSAFGEAGFRTAFYSNQRPNRSFIDFLGQEADEWVFIPEQSRPGETVHPYDDRLLEYVSQRLTERTGKLFIVLHTYGSHFNYRERYPDSSALFRPDDVEGAKPKFRQELVNAYDNTIVHTDRFLSQLTEMLEQSGTESAWIYTSDHGEDIFDDDRRLFLHASPVPSYYQLHVPFVVWMSESYRTRHPECYAHLRANRQRPIASNALFHTMLTVGGVATPYRNDTLSVASARFETRPRYYLNDHNRPCPLDRIGLKKEDFDMFRNRGMACPTTAVSK